MALTPGVSTYFLLTSALPQTAARLKAGSLAVGYFGGSITEAEGWRVYTTNYFRRRYPDATIREINAAIGGTGSELGAYRCRRDLLAFHPDLVFIEFAVNDTPPTSRTARAMEGIVRQILSQNPSTEIVFVYTFHQNQAEFFEKGQTPPAIAVHDRIAAHYGIPTVHVGRALWETVQKGEAKYEDLLADCCHPLDRGHRLYAKVVENFLEQALTARGEVTTKPLPSPLTEAPLVSGTLVYAVTLDAPGWEKLDQSLMKRSPHIPEIKVLASQTPGTELSFRFRGPSIGLYWMIAPDSGNIEWSIDGGPPKKASSWDRYALEFTRANYRILADHLAPDQEHELRIRVLAEKEEQSTGTWIRLGAFLVEANDGKEGRDCKC